MQSLASWPSVTQVVNIMGFDPGVLTLKQVLFSCVSPPSTSFRVAVNPLRHTEVHSVTNTISSCAELLHPLAPWFLWCIPS